MYRPPIPSKARLEAAGGAMRLIRTSKPDVSWIQGPGPADLWTWTETDGAIKEQELTFFGRTVLKRSGQLLTGLCHEGQTGAYHGKTGLIDFDARLDADTLSAAAILIDAIPVQVRGPAVEVLREAIRASLSGLGPANSG
jgi:hypothetical protein